MSAIPPCTGDIPSDTFLFCNHLSDVFADNCVTSCNEQGFSPNSIWIILVMAILTVASALWACMERRACLLMQYDKYGGGQGAFLSSAGRNGGKLKITGCRKDTGCGKSKRYGIDSESDVVM